jgi:DNA-binding beta-propeller fold protein YncE
MRKKPKGLRAQAERKELKAQKEPEAVKSGKNGTMAVICAIAMLLLSAVMAANYSFLQSLQTIVFRALKLPFEDLYLHGVKLGFPPFFIFNFTAACLAAIVVIALFMKKAGAIKDIKAVIKTSVLIAAVFCIHMFIMALFMSGSLHVLQAALFAAEMAMLGWYALGRDRRAGVKNTPGVLAPGEFSALAGFAALLLALLVFDYRSWKYSFIGDEWSFYNFARALLKGGRPLDFFGGAGVYDFNPVMSSIWQAFVMFFTGGGLFGWKLSTALIVPLAVIPFYMWNKLVFNRTAAVIATSAFALSAAMLAFSHIGYNNIQTVFFYAMALLTLELAIRKNSSFWSFAAALVLGLGCYNYYLSRLLIIPAFLYWLCHPKRKGYSGVNIFITLAVYALCVSFLPLGPNFLENMTNRSAIGTSEIADPSARPWYMAMNFIEAFLFFLTKAKDSHFVMGGLTDMLTAAGVLAGFAWMFLSLRKDWRARFLLPSYAILVFFTGGLVQYHYPANTRMQFMLPMLATIAGIGLSRAAALSVYFKNPARAHRAAVLSCAAAIAALNFYNFYIFTPAHFQYSMQTYVIKYLQQNRGRDVLLVTGDISMLSESLEWYGFTKNARRVAPGDFEALLKAGAANGKSVVFDFTAIARYPKIADFCKPGYVQSDLWTHKPLFYVYDFSKDSKYYYAFIELWTTGKTDYRVERAAGAAAVTAGPAAATAASSVPAGLNISPAIKSVFKNELNYSEVRQSAIRQFSMAGLGLGVTLKAPSDLAVSKDGITLYVADAGARQILKFKRTGADRFALDRRIDAGHRGVLDFLRPRVKDGTTGDLYIALNPDFNCMYLLDSTDGKIFEYSLNGDLVKEFAGGRLLKQASSISVSEGGLLIACANPEENMFIILNIDGEMETSYRTTSGTGMGQLNMPCRVVFDAGNNYYVADASNGRVDYFTSGNTYKTNYKIGMLAGTQRPGIAVFNAGVKKPYFAVTQPRMKKLFFFLANKSVLRYIYLGGVKGFEFNNPANMAADADGNLYILDTKAGVIVRLTIPKNAMDGEGR